MNNLVIKESLPDISSLPGVRHVVDASERIGHAAIEVAFVNGLTVTITRDELSKKHFCIWFPPADKASNIGSVMPRLTKTRVMAELNKLAEAAGN